MTVTFGILGPVAATVSGREVDLGGPRPRTLLAGLLLAAGRATPVDRLVDLLWDDQPPPTARSQVKTTVSGLRRVLRGHGIADVISTHAHGYAIAPLGDRLDLNRFEGLLRTARDLAGRGERRPAMAILREALDLWRGPPLAGLGGRALTALADRLTQRRHTALEDYAWMCLAERHHAEVIDIATAVLAEQPVSERFWMLLMLARHRAGDRAGALDGYRAARRRLVDDLGVEPGPDLQRLHRSILAGTESPAPGRAGPAPVAAPPRPPILLPAEPADFVGRAAALDRLRAWLAPPGGGGPRRPVVVVTGRAGAGKSALAIRAAHSLRSEFTDGQLYADLGSALPVTVLGRFLRALGVPAAEIPATLDERVDLYRAGLADRRVLVVLDNAVDEAHLVPLLPGTATCGVVVTSRLRLFGLPGVGQLAVDVLTPAQTRELLARIAGRARVDGDPAAAADLSVLCGHLPLAVRAAASKLAAKPHWTVRRMVERLRDERHRLDELAWGHLSIRDAFAGSYRTLPDDARRLFRRLGALAPAHTAGWVAAALLDRDTQRSDPLLECLVDAHLLDIVAGAGADPTRLRYGLHPLAKVYARERARTEEPDDVLRAALSRAFDGWLALGGFARSSTVDVELHAAPAWAPADDRLPGIVGDPDVWFAAERPALVAAAAQAGGLGLVGHARGLAALAHGSAA